MTIARVQNPGIMETELKKYPDLVMNFNSMAWLSLPDNIALSDEKGNISLYEHDSEGVYTGHVFFNSRGLEAFEVAKSMLNTAFTEHPIEVIRGFTPIEKMAARMFNRKLGFTSYGEIETKDGYCELFIMTKDEFLNRKAV